MLPPPAVPPPVPLDGAEMGSAARDCPTPSATCTDSQLREWVERQLLLGGTQRWVQKAGRDTFDTTDDAFALEPKLGLEGALSEGGEFTVASDPVPEARAVVERSTPRFIVVADPEAGSGPLPAALKVWPPPTSALLGAFLLICAACAACAAACVSGRCCLFRRKQTSGELTESDEDVAMTRMSPRSPMVRHDLEEPAPDGGI
mmetsp:Transcript_74346/g.150985  ORF Transcript_74346/g.150985 Transcript_74346/m.150985 type:complete len:203 (+) Transcript_74346:10-618(+)